MHPESDEALPMTTEHILGGPVECGKMLFLLQSSAGNWQPA